MEPRWRTVAQADCTRAASNHLLARLMEALFCLARRPIVAGAHARPTGQVLGAGKLRHVASGFCQNHGSGFGGDAGDRLQQLVLALEGLEFQQSPLAEFGELVF
jgi:hypothetical protein